MTITSKDESEVRRSNLFGLRAALCLVIIALLVSQHGGVPPLVWLLGTVYLASNLIVRVLPAHWYRNPALGFTLFFLDLAGISTVLYAVAGIGSDSLLLFYLTVLLATLGEDVAKSVGIAFGASALYIWLLLRQGVDPLADSGALIRIPLFLATAIFCGYLAQDLRRRKREIRGLQETQQILETQVGEISDDLLRSEESRGVAQELAQRFRNLLDDLNAVVWEMDAPSLKVTFVSQQAERVLGYPAERWLTERDFWANHIHQDDRENVLDLCRRALSAGGDYNLEYRAFTADGRVVWLQDIVRVVRDDSGRIRKLRGVMVDITESKTLEEELRQAQKMEAVGRLAGGVAHDFNNLLTIIDGYIQLALASLDSSVKLREHLEEVQKASQRAAALTRRLLAFSRRQVLQPQVLDLGAVVGDFEKMLRRLIGEDVELIIVKAADSRAVRADPAQIEQILMNLVVNARDAMPSGGKLVIETAIVELDDAYARSHVAVKPGAYVMLAVSDTGVGMDAETRSHIFEPFFTTKERGKGTGLGLATVYGIVKQSGGYVWVYSEPGKGSSFKIYLPRSADIPVPAPMPIAHLLPHRGSETILVVEDEDAVRSLVAAALRASGYKVLAASHPEEALQACREHDGEIHLLLTDVVMPQMNGRELAERLKSLRPETKILYMSGYTDAAILHHGILERGEAFLQKPFTPNSLARKVREVLNVVLSK